MRSTDVKVCWPFCVPRKIERRKNMIKIAHVHQLASLRSLPAEVMNTIHEAVTILDNEYGEDRDVDSGDGGFVLVIENKAELQALQEIRIDVTSDIPEYVDVIHCQDGQVFASSLILQGSDFGIILVMPLDFLVGTNLEKYMEGDFNHE
jgi:hypothetical protein